MQGIFYGIGVGPGDPELMTVKAIRALKNVDAVIAPKTEKKEGSVALSIAREYLREDAEIVYQVFPMVKDFAQSGADAWEENKREILELLDSGKNVAFLTIGDPFFYSTYIYVFRLLMEAGVRVETIPGVPAFLAIGSRLGRPLGQGEEVLAVIPATAPPEKVKRTLEATDNAVIMKVYKNFGEVADLLEAVGMDKDAVLVSRAGLNDEKILTDLPKHKGEKPNYLSTILCSKNK